MLIVEGGEACLFPTPGAVYLPVPVCVIEGASELMVPATFNSQLMTSETAIWLRLWLRLWIRLWLRLRVWLSFWLWLWLRFWLWFWLWLR